MSSRSSSFTSRSPQRSLRWPPRVGALGCSEVRGRKRIQEANELYKRGRYQEAVAAFEAAEALVPNLPTLWLNKGYTCRQLIAPGGRDPESRRAADCALAAFRRLHELAPNDPRAEQLTVQTWFDTDDFATLEKTFLERDRRAPERLRRRPRPAGGLLQVGEVAAGARVVDARGGAAPERRRGAVRRRHVHLADPGGARRRPGHGGLRSAPAPAPEGDDAGRAPGRSAAASSRRARAGAAAAAARRACPATSPGKARVELADQAIAHLEKAVALRPHYADAMTYLALVWRQKSFALFAEPAAWQQAVDRANEWQKRAPAARAGKS